MEFEKLLLDATSSAPDGVLADVYIARNYDPFSPAQPDPDFAQTLKAAMDGSAEFQSWVEKLGLDKWAAHESE